MDRREFLKACSRSLAGSVLLGDTAGGQPHSGTSVQAVIENGFLATGGLCARGWYAGVVVLDNGESSFCRGLADPGRWACLYEGTGFDAEVRKAQLWREAIGKTSQRLLFRSRANPSTDQQLARAERILGPATPRESTEAPTVVWIERESGQWSLKRFDGTKTHTVLRPKQRMRRPAVAARERAVVIACEVEGPNTTVQLFSTAGAPLAQIEGQRPRLATDGRRLFVLVERATSDSITTHLVELDERMRTVRELSVPARNDYTWKGDLQYNRATGAVNVAVESCGAFGEHEQLSLARDLYCWTLSRGESNFKPLLDENRVPADCNSSAIEPRLFALDGGIQVAYRQYRVSKVRGTFGWDVWLASIKNNRWDSLNRVTANYGTADTGYDILEDGGRSIGVFPCRSHFTGGHITARYWTEVVDIGSPEPRPLPAQPIRTRCETVEGRRQICLEPEPLKNAPHGFQLIWADLHRHTTYSTCQPATNGLPEEHLRFVRDVLGCQVITLTEHGHHMTAAESTYIQDRVEEYAGDKGIVLYADEPNPEPGRHTNFYTTKREIFEQLRTIFMSHGRARADVYRHIRQALPKRSVLAISHFHGKPLPGEAMKALYDPEIDVAMEAMQIRSNVMLDLHRESSGLLFPNDCLDLGLKFGLVGGTDHTFALDKRLNHYCLTGLWVRDATAEGVVEALRSRRTVAMSNGKLAIWATLNGLAMGSEVVVAGGVHVKTELSCHRKIKRVGLMRNGALLQWIAVGKTHASLTLSDPEPPTGQHWYVVTAEMETAYPTSGIGHASPFFVTVRS